VGLSYSKNVRFGAVRFNFSGSGIGVSVGIPGLRIGTGPRGAYISGGAGGFRYRRSLNAPAAQRPAPAHTAPTAYPSGAPTYVPNVAATVEHDTKNVLELTDSSSDALLQSMNEQRKKSPFWPVAAVVAVLAYFMLANLVLAWHPVWRVLLGAVLATAFAWVYWRDSMRKLTVLFFEPDAAADQRFDALRTAAMTAASAHKLKSISSTSRYSDTKYSAGASQGLQFSNAVLKLGQAPGVAANIEVPLLKTGRTTLAFYPDRILAFQGSSVGAVAYSSLQASAERTRYVESESVPSDAHVVDRTWQYVNKSGGPDRRFKDNREIPVCTYSKLILSTSSGLDIRLLGSKEGGMEPLASALAQME
jgi:hypothetical protein